MRGAPVDPHREIVWLDRECFLDVQRIVAPVADREFLENHRHRKFRLDHRELPSDARPHAVAERFVGMGVPFRLRFRQPPVDIEIIGPVPGRRMPVERRSHDVDRAILAQPPFACNLDIFERCNRK